MLAHWRRLLPPAPALPRSLWGTAGALLLALGSYGFRAELWPGHPAAGAWSLALLPALAVVGLLQVLHAVHRWVAAVAGPAWLRLVLRAGLAVVQVGTALLIVAAGLGSVIMLF